tara:strand:- start:534 stop:1211 length:678 start_codon:yes stop_codon:yes gene_type:complete
VKRAILISIVILLLGCSKDDPKPPSSALLIFPLENSECTVGQNINQTTRLINFQWEASSNTDGYELTVTNLNTNVSQVVTTNETSVQLQVKKGVPFSWSVTSENNKVTNTATSELWYFFNAGALTSRAPFPAKINSPKSGETVIKNLNNQVNLSWTGTDLDSDIEAYEVYFSSANPPLTLVTTANAFTQDFDINVIANTVYYWSVKTIDKEGNTSSSGVFSFRAL